MLSIDSFKKKLVLRFSLPTFCFLFISCPAFSQQDSALIKKFDLREVEVTAQRVPAAYAKIARIVSIITKEELKSAGVQTADELLRFLPEIDLRQRGKQGVQSDVALRGGTFDQLLVLLNGVNISDPQTGHFNLNLVPPIESIERIEILHGPASKALGPNAFSGAINFITSDFTGNRAKVGFFYGEHELSKMQASLDFGKGDFQHHLSVSERGSGGYISNTDFDISQFLYTGRWLKDRTITWIQWGMADRDFGANSFYSGSFPNQYESVQTYFGSASFETGDTLKLSSKMYWRRNYDRFLLKREDPSFYENLHQTDAYGANINVAIQSFLGQTSFGTDFRNEEIVSSSLGFQLSEPIDIPGRSGKKYIKGHSRNIISIFVEHNLSFHRLLVSAGIMANSYSDVPDKSFFNPGLEAAFLFTDSFRWFASFNKAMRMPTFTDLFYVDPGNVGNPNLKPEFTTNYESGLRYQAKVWNTDISFFHRLGTDLIDWSKNVASDPWQTDNFNMSANGFTFNFFVNPSNWGFYDVKLSQIRFTYSYLYQKREENSVAFSRYVMDYLKHSSAVSTIVQLPFHFTWQFQINYNERLGAFTDVNGVEQNYKPFWLVDTRLNWHFKKFDIFADIQNLTNKIYYDIDYVPQPGRWIGFGVHYQLDWN